MSSIAASSSGSASATALAANASSSSTSPLAANTSISGTVSFSGLGSGTDFNSVVDQLKDIQSIQKNRLGEWRADWQRRVNAFDVLIDGMTDLSQKLSAMDSLSNFLTKVVSSTKPSAINAVASSDVPQGSYKFNVVQLASNAMLTTQKTIAPDKSEVLAKTGDAVFSYTYGDTVRELRIPQGTTLESFVNIVNNDTRNPGVAASLIKSGDGYIFQIQGKETGTDHDLTINDETTLSGFTNDDAGNWFARKSQDALFYMEGRTEQILSSSSNSLTEVIPGMTITLTDTTDVVARDTDGNIQWTGDPPRLTNILSSEPVMLTVTNDTASAKEKILEFVDAYNTMVNTFRELTKYDSSKEVGDVIGSASQFDAQKGSVLTGNYGVQLLYSQIRSVMAGTGKGFTPLENDGTGDVFWSLATIGIKVDANESSKTFGYLIVAEGESEAGSPFKTLDEALKHDPEAVARILASDKVVRSQSSDFSYVGMLRKDMVTGGNHEVKYTVAPGSPPTVSEVLIDGKPASYDATSKEWTSTADISKGLSIRVDNLTVGEHTGVLSVQQGKINELNEALGKQLKGANMVVGDQTLEKGSLYVLKENYLKIIDNIDKKIEQEEARLTLWETRQRKMFARLEALLASYNSQMSSNESSLATAGSWSNK